MRKRVGPLAKTPIPTRLNLCAGCIRSLFTLSEWQGGADSYTKVVNQDLSRSAELQRGCDCHTCNHRLNFPLTSAQSGRMVWALVKNEINQIRSGKHSVVAK